MASCEICEEKESKYCCPTCNKRTCSLECVKEHKMKYKCEGLRVRPTVPESTCKGSEKYSEDLFIKDYSFLESVSTYANQLERQRVSESERCDAMKVKNEISDERKERIKLFKKIQKVGKLSELRILPSDFSRSKRNRTHLISINSATIESTLPDKPEVKSSRLAKIAWTLEFVRQDNGKLIETKFDVEDDALLSEIIPENVKKFFLRNESKLKGFEKWREVSTDENWRQKRLGQVLVGSRCFEYPIFGLEFE